MTEFMISDNAKELVKNETELKTKLADFFGELPNAEIVDELCDAAKYYTNNGESNVAKYSFRLKDFSLPTMIFSYFAYAYRSMWIHTAILVLAFTLGSSVIWWLTSFFGASFIYISITMIVAASYKFVLLKEFFTKYEITPIPGIRARKLKNILIVIGAIAAVTIIIKLISMFVLGAALFSLGSSRYY